MLIYCNLLLRKKIIKFFSENSSSLIDPSATDLYNMDSMILDEVDEMVDNSKKSIFSKYYSSILEIYNSSYQGQIVRPTSGGLCRPNTPTNDFIDDQVEIHNPFDDLGVD